MTVSDDTLLDSSGRPAILKVLETVGLIDVTTVRQKKNGTWMFLDPEVSDKDVDVLYTLHTSGYIRRRLSNKIVLPKTRSEQIQKTRFQRKEKGAPHRHSWGSGVYRLNWEDLDHYQVNPQIKRKVTTTRRTVTGNTTYIYDVTDRIMLPTLAERVAWTVHAIMNYRNEAKRNFQERLQVYRQASKGKRLYENGHSLGGYKTYEYPSRPATSVPVPESDSNPLPMTMPVPGVSFEVVNTDLPVDQYNTLKEWAEASVRAGEIPRETSVTLYDALMKKAVEDGHFAPCDLEEKPEGPFPKISDFEPRRKPSFLQRIFGRRS